MITSNRPRTIYSIESHEQALGIWRENGTRDAKLLHVDFHCDMRGMLVNRKSQRAYPIWSRFPDVDEGNFLKHAVLEGIISGVRWVHDEPGGRKDDIKSVKFESDLSAYVYRTALALRNIQGIPIDYKVFSTDDWTGIEPGEILDIDWDYFAAIEYDTDSIEKRIESFLALEFDPFPEETIVCFSPEYSHPTRSRFEEFVNQLATKFDASIVSIPKLDKTEPTSLAKRFLKPLYLPVRHVYHFASHSLRKRGIF